MLNVQCDSTCFDPIFVQLVNWNMKSEPLLGISKNPMSFKQFYLARS